MTQSLASPGRASAEQILAFWDERARQFKADGRATLRETHLREVEVRAMMRRIGRLKPRTVLDVGCGNGWSTHQYARQFPGITFHGVDFSGEMIRYARQDAPPNCSFERADVTDPSSLPPGPFDLILTQRCIQNLPDWETQKRAIASLRGRLTAPRATETIARRGGALLLMECSKDGVKQLNQTRVRLGMEPIEGIEPWHNAFLRDGLMKRTFGAKVEFFCSTYMLLAKVVHKRLSYVARYLPAVGRFGYDRLYVVR